MPCGTGEAATRPEMKANKEQICLRMHLLEMVIIDFVFGFVLRSLVKFVHVGKQ